MQAIIYMWQVSACMGIFYGFYYFMLRRLTFFTLNRWYLMATLMVSFIIPLLTITVHEHSAPAVIQKAVIVNQELPSSNFQLITPAKAAGPTIDWVQIAEIAYLIIVAILFIKLVIMVARFFLKVKRASVTRIGQVRIIKGNKNIDNGSFFNYILLADNGLSVSEAEQVIAHELLHVKLFHSVDRVIVKLAQIILWFNPFVYRYAQAIEENHEFEVDNQIGKRADKGRYADMLLHLSVNRQDILFNSFSKIPLKRRITMLFTKPTNHMKKTIYLLVIPVVMISCLAFARLKNDNQTQQYSVVDGVNKLKGDIKLIIDGREYNNSVLYKISKFCIANYKVSENAATPCVTIKTNAGKIVYMTPNEKENLFKERSIPQTQFYTRLHLKDNKGYIFDKLIIHLAGDFYIACSINSAIKAGFYIDDVFYDESQIVNVPRKTIDNISTDYLVSDESKPVDYMKNRRAIFWLKTKQAAGKSTEDGEQLKDSLAPEKKNYATTAFPVAPMTADEKQKLSKLMDAVPSAYFYKREHFQDADGIRHDKITFKLSDGSVSADLGPEDKVGIFIDGEFYNEDAIKKITVEKAESFEITREGYDAKKIPEGQNYAVPFALKTKKSTTPATPVKDKQKTKLTPVIKQGPAKQNATGSTDDAPSLTTEKEDQLIKKNLSKKGSPFFKRYHFDRPGSKGVDLITFKIRKLRDTATHIVTATLDSNVKAGAFIDGKFFTEEEMNKLTPQKVASLGFSFKSDTKQENLPDNYGFSVSFKTETVSK